MPRPKALVPSLRFHISGQAVCEIGGVSYYLGKHGSPESLARYAILVKEYQQNGLIVPDNVTSASLQEMTAGFFVPVEKVSQASEPILVKHLTASFREHARVKYAKTKAEFARLRGVCDDLDRIAGGVLVADFGPRLLKKVRQAWIDDTKRPKCRRYINTLTNAAIRVFQWGVEDELATVEVWTRLRSIEPLKEGQTTANENAPVRPVDIEVVRRTVKELSPIVKAMVRIQVATGMRPSELCSMRPCDIDRSGAEWIYRPSHHKNRTKGKTRSIPIVGDAREALTDYLNRPSQSFCFSPREADAWFRAKMRSERKGYGSRKTVRGTNSAGDCYTPDSYRRAITRAADRAKVEHWFPYQLRHLNLTVIRDAMGVEFAQAMGGHSRPDMTQTYAQLTERKAIEAAKAAPNL